MNEVGTQTAPADTLTGALGIRGAQPAWMTLDEARAHSFTGEIVFEGEPDVLTYLDNGVVYYAERASDAPLGRRLLDAGVLDEGQLEQGTVRIGDIEHLGRLFDREPSIDRDAVMVVTEASTEELVTDLANHVVATVRITAYRHPPSGVHRWFLTPPEAAHQVAPIVEPMPSRLDAPFTGSDELTIEWESFDDGGVRADTLPTFDQFELVMFDPFREAGGDPGETPVAAAFGPDTEPAVPADVPLGLTDDGPIDGGLEMAPFADDLADFEFEVRWPDGSEEPLSLDDAFVDEMQEPAAFTETVDGDLRFEMPPLVLSDDDSDADEVPDDVAAAVRRAIAAIEAAAVVPIEVAFDIDTAAESAGVDADSVLAPEASATEAVAPITTQLPVQDTPPTSAGIGFAPPTLDTSAEVIYARMEAELDAELDAGTAAEIEVEARAETETEMPTGTVAEPEVLAPVGDDRSSALRRLIGSLRRKDR
jgi:hypothetical protein